MADNSDGAGEVSEAEVEAALQAYFGDGHHWHLSMGAAVRAEVLDGMRAALIAARRVQPKQDAPSPDVAGLDEAIAAGSDFRDALVTRADGYNGIAPLWHGWAIMDAFLAGAAWRAALSRLTPPKQDDARDSTVGAVAWRLLSSSGTPGSIFDSEEQAAAVAEGFSGVIVQPLYTAAALASARAEILEGVALMLDARASAAISVRMERIIRNDAAAVRALAFVNKTPVRPG